MAWTKKSAATGMLGLTPELVGEILCRLPFSNVLISRCVCRAWKAAVDEPSFRSSYTDSTKFDPGENYILDSSGKMMRWEPRSHNAPDCLCAISQDNRFLLARSRKLKKLYVGSPFATRWEEIPYLGFTVSSVFLLATAAEQFKVVVDGNIHTFTRGQAEWYRVPVSVLHRPHQVLIQNKLACIDSSHGKFVQFDVQTNKITYKDLSLYRTSGKCIYIASWREKLYLMWLNGGMFTIKEVCAKTGNEIAVVGTHTVEAIQARPNIRFIIIQKDNSLNFVGYGPHSCRVVLSCDLDTGTWACFAF